MPSWLSLLIVAATAAAPTAAAPTAPAPTAQRYPDAVEVFHCDFGPQWDSNLERWPDLWTRLRSAAHPPYLPARISDDPAPHSSRSLRIDLDGGAACLYSPPFKVTPLFSYAVEASAKTEGLVRDQAYVSLTFFDAQKKPLGTFNSQRIGGSAGWTKLEIEPVAPPGATADSAMIELRLEPTGRPDLHGSAWFGDVWAGQLPRMTVSANRRNNVYALPDRPTITCTVAGFAEEHSRVTFELQDVAGTVLARHDQQLGAARGATAPQPGDAAEGLAARPAGVVDTVVWSPPISEPGFYRVLIGIPGRVGVVHQREVTLAVISPQSCPDSGEFGWTLPGGEGPLGMNDLESLISQAGVSWVKFPVWAAGADSNRIDRVVWLAERLHLQHIELVGLLHQPPPEVLHRLGDSPHPLAAQIFSTDPEVWHPSLEPALTSLSLKVRWWQLGLDDDTSFTGYPQATEQAARIRRLIARFGQQVYLGVGASWLNELPKQAHAWDFVSLSANPPLTWEEQSAYLDATAGAKTRRWVVIEPLSRDDYAVDTRAADLAQRMLAAKMHGAEGIFLPDAFNTARGVMNDDGSAGELLLPWRTTALALAGTQYLGSLDLPSGSENYVFGRGDELAMFVWNDRPVREAVYLGENCRRLDLWGRATPLPGDERGQTFDVGPMPVVVTGLNAPLLRWRTSVKLAQTIYPSVFGVAHANVLSVKNSFAQGISGKIRLNTPDGWRTVPRDFSFKLAAGETLNQPFEVTLPLDAVTGRQDMHVEFDLMADRRYQFQVLRPVEVGTNDVYVKVSSRLNERGELEVEQRLTNETESVVSFKCYLYIPDRLPVVTQVVELGRGADTKTFRLPDGAELVGKAMLLRADEIGGQRIINHRFVAQP